MNEMRIFIYYILQSVLILIVFFAAVLPTFLIDVPWGDSRRDGLFLLVIPVYLLPLTLILTLFKFLLIRGKIKERKYKRSMIYPTMMILLASGLAASDSIVAVFLSVGLSLWLFVFMTIEMFTIKKDWVTKE